VGGRAIVEPALVTLSAMATMAPSPTPWDRAAAQAFGQFGVIELHQLIQCGLSRTAIKRATSSGHLIRLFHGVYALGHRPTDPRALLFAATLAGGDGACVSFRHASRHMRFAKWAPHAISVTAPRQRRPQVGLDFHRNQLLPRERWSHRGVPCTTPARTFLDLASSSTRLAEQAIEGASGVGLLDVDDALELIDLRGGSRGVRRLRRILLGHERVPVFTRSRLEDYLYRLCGRGGLERPDMNVEVYGADGQPYECDAVWPRHRLIVECDSGWHDNPVSARDDAERDEQLTLAGWRVFRLRWSQIALQPVRTGATIRRLLADQGRLLSSRV
jgi:hypothetical protein